MPVLSENVVILIRIMLSLAFLAFFIATMAQTCERVNRKVELPDDKIMTYMKAWFKQLPWGALETLCWLIGFFICALIAILLAAVVVKYLPIVPLY